MSRFSTSISCSIILVLLLLPICLAGTYKTHAQDTFFPCKEDNVQGFWRDVDFDAIGLHVDWFIQLPGTFGSAIECSINGRRGCIGVYPNGTPIVFSVPTPGEIRIGWRGREETTVILYDCQRSKDRLILHSDDPEQTIEFILTMLSENEVTNVPTLNEWGLIFLAGVLGIVGFMVIRRKRAVV